MNDEYACGDRLAARLRSAYFVPLALAMLTLAMFAGPLLLPGDRVLFGLDLASEFVYWRQFGFENLRAGHLALWNPHVYGGVPFMGNFQSALLYPANWIYLLLPLAKAINLEIALHVFLFGLLMSIWARRYRLHPLAILLASAVSMFGGMFFLQGYSGHLATVDAMAWTPLILMTIDELVDDPSPKWMLIGIFAVAMHVLAGYPQTTFNTIIACAFYAAMRVAGSRWVLAGAAALVGVAIGAAAICTMPLWIGLNAAGEGTRQGGTSIYFASTFSFPPENLITLLVPGFFGDSVRFAYWGRCYLWEMSPFFGISGVVMAIFGAVAEFRKRTVWIAMVLIFFVLGLGSHTPLFPLLYNYVPGFDHFRAHSKFIFEAVPFMSMLAAVGIDNLLRSTRGTVVTAAAILAAAVITGAVGISLYYGSAWPTVSGGWSDFVNWVWASNETYFMHGPSLDPGFMSNSRIFAGGQSIASAGIMLALAALVWLRRVSIKAVYAIVILGIAEVFIFAHSMTDTFRLADTNRVEIREFIRAHPGDYRVIMPVPSEVASIGIGADDVWGYNPMVLRRYAEMLTFSQHADPNGASDYLGFWNFGSPLLHLVRLRYVFRMRNHQMATREVAGGLPHLLLMSDWKRAQGRDAILNVLIQPSLDPAKTVVLETDPNPPPVAGGEQGSVQLLHSDSDSLTISASLDKPALLLVTDTYSRYFRAVALRGSSQPRYQVLPADYALMAIPLAAGKHLLRLEYAPPGYLIGRWISMLALAAYIVAIGVCLWLAQRRSSGV